MRKLKKILSLLTLIVLVWSDFLTSFSYALNDIVEGSEIVQIETGDENEMGNIEDENISLEDSELENDEMNEESGLWIDIDEISWTGLDLEDEQEDFWIGMEESGETGLDLENVEEDLLDKQVEEELTWNELSKAWEILNDKVIEKSKKYDNVNVSVVAKEWTFPEWTYVTIEPIKAESQINEIREQINKLETSENISQNSEIVAFDIRFEYELSDGIILELQPLFWESVQVTFDYSNNKIFKEAEASNEQEIQVYHINDKDENGEKVEKWEEIAEKIEINQTASAEVDNGLVIDAKSFSTYTIVVQRTEELDENNNPKTWIQWKDFYTINIARPEWLSDGPEWFTIMDRNLWADAYMNELWKSASDWYGYQYQWWNNYGFSSEWNIAITGTLAKYDVSMNHSWYYGNMFITWGIDYWEDDDGVHYNGLWWWENDSPSNHRWLDIISTTAENRQWPCPNWWHVPSAWEWSKLIEYWASGYVASGWVISLTEDNALNQFNDSLAKNQFMNDLKIPLAGHRAESTWNPGSVWVNGYYSSSSPHSEWVYYLRLYGSEVNSNIPYYRAFSYSVRCFRNVYEPNDSSINATGYFKAFNGLETSLFKMSFDKTTITWFTRNTTLELSDVLAKDWVTEIESTGGNYISDYPIYAWIENNNFNWWSEAETVYFHPDTVGAFNGMSGMKIIDLTWTSTELVENFAYWFNNNKILTTIKWKINTNGVKMFDDSGVTYLETVEHDSPTSQWMSFMFNDCKKLTSVDLSEFNTTNVIDMKRMFAWCESMTEIDVSNFDTHNVKTFYWMFRKMLKIQEIDASNFDTSSGINMLGMFTASTLKTLILWENWDTSNVEIMREMFYNCTNLETIYADIDFDTSSLTNQSNMFKNDTKLVWWSWLVNETHYDSSKIGATYAKIASDYPAQNGYFTKYTTGEYTIIFENWNWAVLWSGKVGEGVVPVYSWDAPSRPSTEESVYTFTWWYPELHPATHDETYMAIYTEWTRYYTVTLTWTPAWYGTLSPESLSKEYDTAIVIDWDQLTIGWTEVTLIWNEWYEFQEWTGNCGQTTKQVCDEVIVYSHPDSIEFTGGNNIVITSEGYDLFSQSGFQKDFEISFDILSLNLSGSPKQATLLSVKNEDLKDKWPWFSFRKNGDNNSELELSIRGWSIWAITKIYKASDVHSVKISRENGKLYMAINGWNNEEVYDFAWFTNYFDKPITIGSIYQNWGYDRYIKATLSNILIKTIDTTSCHTWNVYIVTWDCQMTAIFQEIGDKNTVRFIDGESVYATSIVLSWEEVTPPADPEKSGYDFVWWFVEWAESPFVFSGTPITWNLDLYAHWATWESHFTINCNKKRLNINTNQLLNESDPYLTWIIITWVTANEITVADYSDRCNTDGYEYAWAIVYGSDDESGSKVSTTTILADGTRVIEMYFQPVQNLFTLNSASHTSTQWSSENGLYYYGAIVTLSGASNDDCYSRNEWNWLPDWTINSAQTSFEMPDIPVTVTPTVRENTYNIIFNGNGNTSWTMSPMNGVRCTESTWLTLNTFGKTWHTFTGWSTTAWWSREYIDGATVDRLSTWADVNLYAVRDINKYNVNASVAAWDHGSLQWSWAWIYEFGETLIFIAVPELGYLFDYWEVNNRTGDDLPDGAVVSWNELTIIVDQILNVIAHFTENVWTVTVNYYEMNTGGMYPWVTNSTTFTWLVWYTGYATLNPPYGFYLDTERTVNTWIVISDNDAENIINIYYARDRHYITLWYTGAFVNPNSVEVIPTPRTSWYYYGENVHFAAVVNTWYVFKQWRVNWNPVAWDADGVDFVMLDEDVELVVDWNLIIYTIDYYTEPWYSDPEHENPHAYTVLSGEIEIYNPKAEFCNNFLWWTWGTTWDWILTPQTGLVIDSSKGWDREYHANWERKSYEVTLEVDPLSWWTVTWAWIYRCMGTIELHATPNTWYHFVWWYDNIWNLVSDSSMYVFYAPEGELWTWLTAKFEINQYYVSVDKVGSWWFQPESAISWWYNHGSEITVKASPALGYKLRKWSKNWHDVTWENGELYTWTYLDLTVTETENITVYYEPETYSIIYMDWDSILSWLTPSTYTVENHVYSGDLPTITKNGYIFEWWFTEYPRQQYNRVQEIWEVPVNGKSVTIYAWWTPVDYDINYYLLSWETINWEEYYPSDFYQSYTVETAGTSLPTPQKSGYVFSWWMNHWEPISTFGWWMTWDLDLYPTWKSDVMDIVVNYYEMDTNGQYPYDPEHNYPTHRYSYTGLTESGFVVPDYSKTGFNLDWSIHTEWHPSITISWNSNANVINVYYARAHNFVQVMWDPWSNISISSCSGYSSDYYFNCEFYFGTEVSIQHWIYDYDEWYEYSGWYIDPEYPLPEGVEIETGGTTFNMPDHGVHLHLYTNHILYKLTFTWYEWAEVTNTDTVSVNLTGVNEVWFDTELELPYLSKPWYDFVWWNEWNSNVWWVAYTLDPYHPRWNMPSHDIELTAEFSPRTTMEYTIYYYLQDINGTGYTLDYDLTESKYDGETEQQLPYPSSRRDITWFEYTWFGYDGIAMRPWEEWPTIKATWDNYVNLYYDRKVDSVYVEYDAKKMSVVWTGKYRYGAPVTLTATVKAGYEFSGFTSYQGELLTSGSVYDFTMPDSYVYLYANADPIIYSIEYEMYGWWLTPYQWYKTGYTVDWDFDLDIFDAVKDGYIFLWWTWWEIWVRELTEPTTWLVIPLWSTWNRKYFANFEATWSNITVNYYLKKIDPENNVLTGGSDVYKESVIYTWLTDSVVDIQSLYGTWIEGYSYTTAIVYGSDLSGWVETGTTTILWDQSRVIDIYYTPKKYDFTVIEGPNTTTSWTSNSTWYYFGAYVTLSGDSTEACFGWDKWWSSDLPEWKNQQHTTFEMPAHNVTVESMVSEKSYNIVFDANGGTWTMSTLSVQCTSWTLSPNNFERNWYTFTGWSRNSDWPVEFTGESDIHRLSTESGWSVTLYAVWDANLYTVTFDLNGWKLTWDMTFTTGYTIETHAISLDDYIPYKSWYIFTWWYRGDNLVNSIAWWETWDYTLTANWDGDIVFLHISYLWKTLDWADYYIMSETWDFPKVGSFYEAEIKDFSGFTYDPTEPRNITWMIVSYDSWQNDIQIYYKRDEYPLIIN